MASPSQELEPVKHNNTREGGGWVRVIPDPWRRTGSHPCRCIASSLWTHLPRSTGKKGNNGFQPGWKKEENYIFLYTYLFIFNMVNLQETHKKFPRKSIKNRLVFFGLFTIFNNQVSQPCETAQRGNYRAASSKSLLHNVACNVVAHFGPHKGSTFSGFHVEKLCSNPTQE